MTPEQIEAAQAKDNSFADILSAYESEHKSAPGAEALTGTVVAVTGDAVTVDIGRKMEGLLKPEQVRDSAGNCTVKRGDTVQVSVTGRDENLYYTLSLSKIVVPKDWSGLQKAFAEKSIVTATVMEVIKGGLRVDVGVRAFLPASRSGEREQAAMEGLVGQQIECRITKLDVEDEDVVVDRRSVLEERAIKAKQEAFARIQEGVVVSGTVRTLMDFGAFVDLGGVDGLLHVSDMSWSRGAKVEDIVRAGQQVEVKILKVQPETRKISLGMKQLQPDPWTVAAAALQVGERAKGRVTRVTDFGAFVELQPGVEGLIHVSEMSWSKKQRKASEMVKAGDLVEAVVLGVKVNEKRIALGLKQALGDPWEDAVKRFPKGTIVDAPVISVQNFGVFLELGEGIEGMIHIGDITNEKRLEHPREVMTAGQVVKAQVTELDHQRKRIRLSMKSLEPTSADEYIAEHKVGDEVSGRVVEAGAERSRVELGEGVTATCRPKAKVEAPAESRGPADLSSMTALLAAKWKKGESAAGGGDQMRTGEVRRFRITKLDAEARRIEVELA
jgi:small subunit ribosomal protein S1